MLLALILNIQLVGLQQKGSLLSYYLVHVLHDMMYMQEHLFSYYQIYRVVFQAEVIPHHSEPVQQLNYILSNKLQCLTSPYLPESVVDKIKIDLKGGG